MHKKIFLFISFVIIALIGLSRITRRDDTKSTRFQAAKNLGIPVKLNVIFEDEIYSINSHSFYLKASLNKKDMINMRSWIFKQKKSSVFTQSLSLIKFPPAININSPEWTPTIDSNSYVGGFSVESDSYWDCRYLIKSGQKNKYIMYIYAISD